MLFDPTTSKEDLVESDPLKRVDFGNAVFSEVSDELIATIYEDERERIYFKDKAFEADHKHLRKQLPGKELNFTSSPKMKSCSSSSLTPIQIPARFICMTAPRRS